MKFKKNLRQHESKNSSVKKYPCKEKGKQLQFNIEYSNADLIMYFKPMCYGQPKFYCRSNFNYQPALMLFDVPS